MQSQEFVTYTLMPYITRIEQEMNLKLFRTNELGKTFVEFNVNGLLRGDVKSRTEAYKTAITNGYMSINEVRQKENMNSIEGGDKHFHANEHDNNRQSWTRCLAFNVIMVNGSGEKMAHAFMILKKNLMTQIVIIEQ